MNIENISRAVAVNFVLTPDPNGKNKLYCDSNKEEDSEAAVVAAIGVAVEKGFSHQEIMDEYRIYEKEEIDFKLKKFFRKLKTNKIHIDGKTYPRFQNKVTLIHNYLKIKELEKRIESKGL